MIFWMQDIILLLAVDIGLPLDKAKQLVCKLDPPSFIIVSNASEIFGEGYKAHGAEEL